MIPGTGQAVRLSNGPAFEWHPKQELLSIFSRFYFPINGITRELITVISIIIF